jgi:hypothetical protein
MGISIEAAGRFEPPGLGRGIGLRFPDLHRPLRRDQQPAEPGAVALIGGHFLAQGGEAAGLSTELSGRRMPEELSNPIQLPVARAQA